jgi:hypothetical protein
MEVWINAGNFFLGEGVAESSTNGQNKSFRTNSRKYFVYYRTEQISYYGTASQILYSPSSCPYSEHVC